MLCLPVWLKHFMMNFQSWFQPGELPLPHSVQLYQVLKNSELGKTTKGAICNALPYLGSEIVGIFGQQGCLQENWIRKGNQELAIKSVIMIPYIIDENMLSLKLKWKICLQWTFLTSKIQSSEGFISRGPAPPISANKKWKYWAGIIWTIFSWPWFHYRPK